MRHLRRQHAPRGAALAHLSVFGHRQGRKEQRFWDGQKAVYVVLLGSTVVLPCINRRKVWTDWSDEEDDQQVWALRPRGHFRGTVWKWHLYPRLLRPPRLFTGTARPLESATTGPTAWSTSTPPGSSATTGHSSSRGRWTSAAEPSRTEIFRSPSLTCRFVTQQKPSRWNPGIPDLHMLHCYYYYSLWKQHTNGHLTKKRLRSKDNSSFWKISSKCFGPFFI